MLPNKNKITIHDNLTLIEGFLVDLIIKPRVDIHKWSEITKQTPTLKIGYIGQHLSSLILGMEGGRTGARGHDIIDGTEVKSCTKVDQADKCKDCGERLMRSELVCFNCGSSNIDRKDDSKWLFSIRSEEELNQYKRNNRIFLLISDYPNFKNNDFSSIRFEGFEIYPTSTRMSNFNYLVDNHYFNIYSPKAQAGGKTNPMNLHPYSFQFYMCNPIKVFSCIIEDIDKNPTIRVNKYISPYEDRTSIESENMPIDLLRYEELRELVNNCDFDSVIKPNLIDDSITKDTFFKFITKDKRTWQVYLPTLNEKAKSFIKLREIKSVTQQRGYIRS